MTARRLLAAALIATLAACSRTGPHAGSNASLTISIPIAPNTLNPILQTTTTELFLTDLMFPKLIGIDLQHRDIPWLASQVPTKANGGISADGRTITYHLRTNAVWSDGTPVTSRDVKFTYEAIMNPANNVVSRHGWSEVASVDTPDAHTVVVHLKRPFPPILSTFFGESDSPYEILPAHVLARYHDLNQARFNADPTVTCGPYRFVNWVRGDHITLAANPHYYLGAPKIAKLIVKFIADTNTNAAELRTGEVQASIELTGPEYHSLANDPNVARLAIDAPAYDAIMLNTARAPLNDRAVRVALAYATDRATISRNSEYGEAPIGVGDLSPFYWAFDRNLHAQPFDPARARAMLSADGWKTGPNGIREKNGKPLSLLLVYGAGSDLARNIVVQIQQMWRAVGVQVEPKSYDYTQMLAPASDGGIVYGGKYDVSFQGWLSGADPDDSSQWMSTSIPPNGNNMSRFSSKAMDAAQHLALSTYARARRKRAYAKIQRILVDDVPAIFLFYQKMHYAFTPGLKNFHPNGVDEAWNANQWTW